MTLGKKISIFLLAFVNATCFAYEGPIIDGHAHWGDRFNEAKVLDRYSKSGVIAPVVMPRYLGVRGDWLTTDDRVLEIAARTPGKIGLPLVC